MSDEFLKILPRSPEHVPGSDDSVKRAVALLQKWLPAADVVKAETFPKPVFIDCGGNWSGVKCPRCGADLDSEWSDRMDTWSSTGRLEFTTSCCSIEVSLNELNYVWTCGFARFVLSVQNPNVRELSATQIQAIAELLGTDVTIVRQHL